VSQQELAQSRRAALRLRARRIRQGVAGLALALFSAAFLTVYVQLASGHDPALSAAAKRRTSGSVASSTGAFSGSESAAPGEETSAGEEPASAESPSAVTSRQS
jgi:hypothetical protein